MQPLFYAQSASLAMQRTIEQAMMLHIFIACLHAMTYFTQTIDCRIFAEVRAKAQDKSSGAWELAYDEILSQGTDR